MDRITRGMRIRGQGSTEVQDLPENFDGFTHYVVTIINNAILQFGRLDEAISLECQQKGHENPSITRIGIRAKQQTTVVIYRVPVSTAVSLSGGNYKRIPH